MVPPETLTYTKIMMNMSLKSCGPSKKIACSTPTCAGSGQKFREQRQEDHEFKATLVYIESFEDYTVRLSHKNFKQNSLIKKWYPLRIRLGGVFYCLLVLKSLSKYS